MVPLVPQVLGVAAAMVQQVQLEQLGQQAQALQVQLEQLGQQAQALQAPLDHKAPPASPVPLGQLAQAVVEPIIKCFIPTVHLLCPQELLLSL